MVENDYVMRMIKDLVKTVAKLVLNKEVVNYELPEENHYTVTDNLYQKLIDMVDEGLINDAENHLYKELDFMDMKQFEMALSFYSHINDLETDFLDDHDYSREEIKQGIESISKEFGVFYDADIFAI